MASIALRKKRRSRVGLNAFGRVDWSNAHNLSCLMLVDYGMHARTIAQATGLTIGQVHNRCRKAGRKLRDYRNGDSPIAEILIRRYNIRTITDKDVRSLKRAILTPDKLG